MKRTLLLVSAVAAMLFAGCESKKVDKPTDVSAEDFEDLDDSEDLPF